MFDTEIHPRFCETDALQHISNTVLPIWFEASREPVFRAVLPSMAAETWPFIVAHIDVDYVNQIFIEQDVTITAGVSKVGDKSFTVFHIAKQGEKVVATGSAVLVYFNYKTHETESIPDDIRTKLSALYEQFEEAKRAFAPQ